MKRNNSRCILLFVKAPVEGFVKKRLAARIGAQDALMVYRAFVSDIIETIKCAGSRSSADIRIYCHPEDGGCGENGWPESGPPLFMQEGADLGARMYNALQEAAEDGYSRFLLVGSDIPELTEGLLADAFSALGTLPAVIGPAMDGGYYLIGFAQNSLFKEAFTDIAWSRPDVFEKTVKRLRETVGALHVLSRLSDIDTFEDLMMLVDRLASDAAGGAKPPPNLFHSRLALRKMGLI
ncbi:MAG: TIGR04282 family arsenosugar biosynthesis glycosyltransferase [Desulfosalsimonadaceae bacterium]